MGGEAPSRAGLDAGRPHAEGFDGGVSRLGGGLGGGDLLAGGRGERVEEVGVGEQGGERGEVVPFGVEGRAAGGLLRLRVARPKLGEALLPILEDLAVESERGAGRRVGDRVAHHDAEVGVVLLHLGVLGIGGGEGAISRSHRALPGVVVALSGGMEGFSLGQLLCREARLADLCGERRVCLQRLDQNAGFCNLVGEALILVGARRASRSGVRGFSGGVRAFWGGVRGFVHGVPAFSCGVPAFFGGVSAFVPGVSGFAARVRGSVSGVPLFAVGVRNLTCGLRVV